MQITEETVVGVVRPSAGFPASDAMELVDVYRLILTIFGFPVLSWGCHVLASSN
ncbi:Hypothetical protein [Corynebacterium glutamicum ATCC 13032]|uniref:Uncharacterized protein n=1 Tax=Corynebacterium glutamicum (strain ATCC 13032 / DSM 20300 / JCM 1318 / BCRC 11384 / CCUG 27702 / LMG 3730 / NBRC 12168 / NCIMB 10025 / NRRL B-2784 / 534) TaxID=196627 RepID=Q8NPX2_CORGL|nr:Hypothetical protein [Corynebacterium glutamicum ATCC 13032]